MRFSCSGIHTVFMKPQTAPRPLHLRRPCRETPAADHTMFKGRIIQRWATVECSRIGCYDGIELQLFREIDVVPPPKAPQYREAAAAGLLITRESTFLGKIRSGSRIPARRGHRGKSDGVQRFGAVSWVRKRSGSSGLAGFYRNIASQLSHIVRSLTSPEDDENSELLGEISSAYRKSQRHPAGFSARAFQCIQPMTACRSGG